MTVPHRRRKYSDRSAVARQIVRVERSNERFAARKGGLKESAHRIFDEGQEIEGSPGEAILLQAGIVPPYPPALRYAPRKLGEHSIIAAFTPLRRPQSVAAVVRAGIGDLGGSVGHEWRDDAHGGGVLLGEIGPQIIVAERLDSALLASRAARLPAVATIEAKRLACLELPGVVRSIFVAQDLQPSPESADAAFTLARRVAVFGVSVSLLTPPIGAATWREFGLRSRRRWHRARARRLLAGEAAHV